MDWAQTAKDVRVMSASNDSLPKASPAECHSSHTQNPALDPLGGVFRYGCDQARAAFLSAPQKRQYRSLDRTMPLRSRLSTNLGQVYPHAVRVHP